MKTLKFKCTLLSDVILNMKSATTGPNQTLDFIPGSNFLGVAAAALYPNLTPKDASLLFHSGKVRFGDAHPSQGGVRGLKVPASMYYPKLSSAADELYIHHMIPSGKDMGTLQLKQCRNGFFDFSSLISGGSQQPCAEIIPTSTSFALKSAYDRNERRSKDEQLFGYQSLDKGLTMYFSVEVDDVAEALTGDLTKALCEGNRIGRSRSAQYGLVKIEPADFIEVDGGKPLDGDMHNFVAVYADSRLIFLDDYGMPTFRPTAAQLGLEGEIDWEKSQVRTFRYAPWNFKRQCFDTDRCGIEKGSVLVVKLPEGYKADLTARYVGVYRNEGFGKVIYNPAFLGGDAEGKALCRLEMLPKAPLKTADIEAKDISTPLLSFLRSCKSEDEESDKVFAMVNKWVKGNMSLFSHGEYASQWGTIRSMAVTAATLDDLREDLFGNNPKQPGYLVHGVAKEKWEGKRLVALQSFFNSLLADRDISDYMARMAVVNLAAEMAKKCK